MKRTRSFSLFGALLVVLFDACRPDERAAEKQRVSEPWFESIGDERGLVFQHVSGHSDEHWMPEIMGGGCALFDADGDGDLDAYLVQSGRLEPARDSTHEDALFENRGGARFAAVLPALRIRGYGMGVAAGDADEDGDPDLYVTAVGPNALLENRGGLRFADVGPSSGTDHPGWGTSAAFFDADRDGDLDLFVANYLDWTCASELPCLNALSRPDYCSPKNYKTPARSVFYENAGAGRFVDRSEASGIAARRGNGLGVAIGDLDGNGWLDVFVANDGMANHLFRNQGGLRFVESALIAGCGVDSSGQEKAGMGVVVADLDGDLDLDLVVCNLAGESDSVFLNQQGFFVDRTATSGLGPVSRPYTRFGIGVFDFDHDGLLDLFEATGRVQCSTAGPAAEAYAEENLLFRGLAPGLFAQVPLRGGVSEPLRATSRAAAFGDVDGDGALDVLVVNRDGPAHLLRNRAGHAGHWLLLRVLEGSGRDALGATLELRVAGQPRRCEVASASSYLSACDSRVHQGLGRALVAEDVVVAWVDGKREAFGSLAADRLHELRRGRGRPLE